MRKILSLFVVLLCVINSRAADYTDFLTAERGFTEVKSTSEIETDGYYYILTPAEDVNFIVGIGTYADKPGWASNQSKSLRYKSAETDPMFDRTNFFTIDWRDEYIALRNLVYSGDVFQTHGDASWMYVNTFTAQGENVKEWGGLIASFQDGYWTFEEGKYPGNFLAPWNNIIADNEAIAGNGMNRNYDNDAPGHFRIFRIAKNNYETFYQNAMRETLLSASNDNPVDATFLITNPSFETGDTSGWTPTGDLANNNEIGAKGSVTSNGEGGYTFNSFQWWSSLSVSQTAYVPSGIYDVSAVVAAWEIDNVSFSAGGLSVTETGQGDMTGIPVTLGSVVVGSDNSLTISASSNADWWSDGRSTDTNWQYACGFFKLDNVQLICKGLYIGAVAQPLPNNETTVLAANQWYYYDAPADGKYILTGNLIGMVYTDEDEALLPEISENLTKNEMSFNHGRIYFKTKRSDATLKVGPAMDITTFTACALNVDGLPEKILIININSDGPGSNGTKLISSYINNKGYDIIGFSEDFNYHSDLTSNMSGYNWGYHRGSVSGLNNNTDGLEYATKNSVATFTPYPETTNNASWTKFNTSEGGTSGGGNTLIKKGYRYYETTVNGVTIDVFITHMDADGGDEDHTSSRNAQWTELANAIKAKNNGRPKILMGDTNSRWTRENIKSNFVDALSDTYNVQDTWVEMCRDGNYDGLVDESGYGWGIVNDSDPSKFSAYEVVDKIFYLNPKADNTYRLIPQSWKLELDYTKSDGTQLGDHKPCVVEFSLAYNEFVDNTVVAVDPEVSFDTSAVNLYVGDSNTQVVTTNSDGAVTYSSSNSAVVTVDESTGLVTAVGAGSATITATIAATSSYNEGSATYTVIVSRKTATISFEISDVTIDEGETYTQTVTYDGDGTVSYESSDTSVATVNSSTGEVTAVGVGTATITATASQTTAYSDATATYQITVNAVILIGDVDNNGTVDHDDLTAMVQILLGGDTTEYDLNAADMNGDGEITLSDLTALVNILLPEEE